MSKDPRYNKIEGILEGKIERIAKALTQDIKGIGIPNLCLGPLAVARHYNVTEGQALKALHIVRDNGTVRDGAWAETFKTN